MLFKRLASILASRGTVSRRTIVPLRSSKELIEGSVIHSFRASAASWEIEGIAKLQLSNTKHSTSASGRAHTYWTGRDNQLRWDILFLHNNVEKEYVLIRRLAISLNYEVQDLRGMSLFDSTIQKTSQVFRNALITFSFYMSKSTCTHTHTHTDIK